MICNKCGAENQNDSSVCAKCGDTFLQFRPNPNRRLITAFIVVLLVLGCVCGLSIRHYHKSSPDYALKVIKNIHTSADVERYSVYLTPKGREVKLWMLSKAAEQPLTGSKTTNSKPEINGDVCNYSCTQSSSEGQTVYTMQFKKAARWQLDDIYIDTLDGQKIKLWISCYKDIFDALEAINKVHSPADVEHYATFFTPKGRDVYVWLLSTNDNTPSSALKTSSSEPLIVGDVCTFNITTESKDVKVTIAIQLRKTEKWQFDDMYFESVNEKKIALWGSYMKNHPVLTYLQLNWHDLKGAFIKGYMITALICGG